MDFGGGEFRVLGLNMYAIRVGKNERFLYFLSFWDSMVVN